MITTDTNATDMNTTETTGVSANLHMTAEVWNAIVDMMNTSQMENFIEYLEFIQERLISDEVVTNDVEDFGGANYVLHMLNAFKRMENLFRTINQAMEKKGAAV